MTKTKPRYQGKKASGTPSLLHLTLRRGTETLHQVLARVSPNDLQHLQGMVDEVDFLVTAAHLAALTLAPLDPTERKLRASRVRGLLRIVELRRSAEPTLDSREVCKLLEVSRETIRQMVNRRQLFELTMGRVRVYPTFQFRGGAVIEGFSRVLKALDADSVFTILSFFLCQNPAYGKKSAVEMLEAGDIEPVLAEARAFPSGQTETGNDSLTRSELLQLHQRALKRVRKMTLKKGFQSLVASGIYTPDGKLAKEYGG